MPDDQTHPSDPDTPAGAAHDDVVVATRVLAACGSTFPREEISIADVIQLAGAVLAASRSRDDLQTRMRAWVEACFGAAIANDTTERGHRMLEEAIELHQANGCTQGDAHLLVDYVYARPPGVIGQEVGGVVLTLAAFCAARGISFIEAGEEELRRVWSKIEVIRAKQAQKVKDSPLPTRQAEELHGRLSASSGQRPRTRTRHSDGPAR